MTVPADLAPMLATPGPLPPEDGRWAYEVKWDGVRTLVTVAGERVGLRSRNGRDITASYPELTGLGGGRRPMVLDAEVVAFNAAGRPDFGRLQSRMHVTAPPGSLVTATPVTLVVFDVLVAGGRRLLRETYDTRREVLEGLAVSGAHWQVPPAFAAGVALLASTREQGLEGVVAKRRDSGYEPGRRSDCWVKVKHVHRQSAVVIGWKGGEGGRTGRIGSLLLAVRDGGALAFAGHVGTGFPAAVLRQLAGLLAPVGADSPACEVPREHARVAHWVRPELVVDVDYTGWTADGRLRHPSYRGLRDDLDPTGVQRETP